MEGGFENKSHFIRVFKNKFGVPPGKLRSLISDREPTPVLTNLTV
jgi:AraC-like DNA-binding protein